MTSHSEIRVYTDGMVQDGTGAYAYIVLESEDCGEVAAGDGKGILSAPSELKAKFAQAGKATDGTRMKMRAVYEGVRHCPDNAHVTACTDNFLLADIMQTTRPDMMDGDIAERFRRYVAGHRITVRYAITSVYNGSDLPCNDQDEWTWYAHRMCEDAIEQYRKENGYETESD